MKVLLKIVLAFLFLLDAGALVSQPSNPQIILVVSAPSGACAAGLPDQQTIIGGALYSCQNGTWGQVGGGGGGSGTVTTVSVVTANGVSGSVANPTTTPAITLALGAITPTSTNGVPAATMAFMDATSSVQTQLNGKQATPTGTGIVRNTGAATELSGDCTTSGSNLLTCTKTSGTAFSGLATLPGVAAGDIAYYNGSAWTRLAGNASGTNVLQENSSGVPSWVAQSVGGCMTPLTSSIGSAASNITISSIPGTCNTLVVTFYGGSNTANEDMVAQFNGDIGNDYASGYNSYSQTATTPTQSLVGNTTNGAFFRLGPGSHGGNNATYTCIIANYTSTAANKAIACTMGGQLFGAGFFFGQGGGFWNPGTSAAITSVKVFISSGNNLVANSWLEVSGY